jgi:hypothetical protein
LRKGREGGAWPLCKGQAPPLPLFSSSERSKGSPPLCQRSSPCPPPPSVEGQVPPPGGRGDLTRSRRARGGPFTFCGEHPQLSRNSDCAQECGVETMSTAHGPVPHRKRILPATCQITCYLYNKTCFVISDWINMAGVPIRRHQTAARRA